jgi:hypothetical protein
VSERDGFDADVRCWADPLAGPPRGGGARLLRAIRLGDRGDHDYRSRAPLPHLPARTIVTAVTGGTGPFSDASATLISIPELSPISIDGVTLVNSVEGITTGEVSYRYGGRSVTGLRLSSLAA